MQPSRDTLAQTALALLDESRFEDAVRALAQAPEAVATDFELSWNLGWAYFKLGRLLEARNSLLCALAISPDSAIGNWALAMVHHEARDRGSAERYYRRALALKPSSLARQGLALLYLEQGRRAEAEALHLESIRRQPGNEDRLRDYAAFLSDTGREAESQDILNSLIGPGVGEAKEPGGA